MWEMASVVRPVAVEQEFDYLGIELLVSPH